MLTYISLVSVKAVYISICSGFAKVRLFVGCGVFFLFCFLLGFFFCFFWVVGVTDIYFASFYKSCLNLADNCGIKCKHGATRNENPCTCDCPAGYFQGDECGMFVTIASLSTRNLKEMNVVCL